MAGGFGSVATLGNNTQIPLPDLAEVLEIRKELFNVKKVLWDYSHLSRVQTCGKKPIGSAVSVKVGGKGNSAGFGNLESCGSVWACPTCAKKVSSVRADEIARAVTDWQGKGFSIGFLTFTMRHFKGRSLNHTWEALQYAWGRVISGRKFQEIKARYDIAGYIRVIETTHSDEFGWHPHVHVLFFFNHKQTQEYVEYLGAELFQTWKASLIHKGFPAPYATVKKNGVIHRVGVDARLLVDGAIALGEYFAKSIYPVGHKTDEAFKMGHEVASGLISKYGREGGRTPFQILKNFILTGDMADLALWHEWEHVSKGKRQIIWSRGLRKLLALPIVERTDEEIAADDTAGTILVFIPAVVWYDLLREAPEFLPLILYWADSDHTGAFLIDRLDYFGIGWRSP